MNEPAGKIAKNRLGLLLIPSGWIVAALLGALLVMEVALQPRRIGSGDILNVRVLGTLPDQPIEGEFRVASDGSIWLGQSYGAATVAGLTVGKAHDAVVTHLSAILAAPEVTIALVEGAGPLPISSRLLAALGWIGVVILAILLAATTVRSYTVPKPRRRALQFSVGALLWLMLLVALAIFAFNERRERLRVEAALENMAIP
jgi:hypothetical protein